MRFVTAIDSFKGSRSAESVALVIEQGILSVFNRAEVKNFLWPITPIASCNFIKRYGRVFRKSNRYKKDN